MLASRVPLLNPAPLVATVFHVLILCEHLWLTNTARQMHAEIWDALVTSQGKFHKTQATAKFKTWTEEHF